MGDGGMGEHTHCDTDPGTGFLFVCDTCVMTLITDATTYSSPPPSTGERDACDEAHANTEQQLKAP